MSVMLAMLRIAACCAIDESEAAGMFAELNFVGDWEMFATTKCDGCNFRRSRRNKDAWRGFLLRLVKQRSFSNVVDYPVDKAVL